MKRAALNLCSFDSTGCKKSVCKLMRKLPYFSLELLPKECMVYVTTVLSLFKSSSIQNDVDVVNCRPILT